ncbi:MAG: hypothetical protein KBT82_02185 [Marinobacter sp.]|uniref:hypothetical protein n=1 Tax=Marinobacter sp. TaxID=50741 RepID=UPI001B5C5A61|nr:hypothetical protein [Marinobacter sp.]MBQ0745556.1 hypothetical protein [Marinobacter sp.]MBQ0812988.1 hypothetical protein [Marinobacter sp.]
MGNKRACPPLVRAQSADNPAIFGGQMPVTSGMVAVEAKPDGALLRAAWLM